MMYVGKIGAAVLLILAPSTRPVVSSADNDEKEKASVLRATKVATGARPLNLVYEGL